MGGTHTINAMESDFGLIDVDQAAWTLSPVVTGNGVAAGHHRERFEGRGRGAGGLPLGRDLARRRYVEAAGDRHPVVEPRQPQRLVDYAVT